jgi:hypothetical protein
LPICGGPGESASGISDPLKQERHDAGAAHHILVIELVVLVHELVDLTLLAVLVAGGGDRLQLGRLVLEDLDGGRRLLLLFLLLLLLILLLVFRRGGEVIRSVGVLRII